MKRFSDHKVISGKSKVAEFLAKHSWTDRPDLKARGEAITGTPISSHAIREDELGQIGVISNDGWFVALHKDEASFIEHRHRIFANRDKA